MKYLAKIIFLTFLVAPQFYLNSCTKKKTEPEPQLTQQLASPTIVAELRALGMTIIETGKPVNVEGIYEMKPEELMATNIPDDWEVGHVFEDPYRFQFSNQNESQQSISTKYKVNKETGQSSEGFVAGSGNKFTVISVVNSSKENTKATLKSLEIISGEWTSTGIKNMQWAFYVLEKNDPDSTFVDVGSIRVSKDEDGLASKVSVFRLPADEAPEKHEGSSGKEVRVKR